MNDGLNKIPGCINCMHSFKVLWSDHESEWWCARPVKRHVTDVIMGFDGEVKEYLYAPCLKERGKACNRPSYEDRCGHYGRYFQPKEKST